MKVPLNGDDYELGVSSFEPFGGSDNQKFEISETQKHIFITRWRYCIGHGGGIWRCHLVKRFNESLTRHKVGITQQNDSASITECIRISQAKYILRGKRGE